MSIMCGGRKMNISMMVCSECGNLGIPVLRPLGRQREKNHKKTLYCPCCMKDTICVEKKQNMWYY